MSAWFVMFQQEQWPDVFLNTKSASCRSKRTDNDGGLTVEGKGFGEAAAIKPVVKNKHCIRLYVSQRERENYYKRIDE